MRSRSGLVALALTTWMVGGRVAAAAEEAPPAPANEAAALLAKADAAVDAGDLATAAALYARIAVEHPTAAEAREARRAVKLLAARPVNGAPPPPVPAAPVEMRERGDEVVVRSEPFSLRTYERVRLTAWEKIDFGVTAFLYGMSLGTSFALSRDSSASDATGPIAIGALSYTVGAVAFLHTDPDRGDLPLALAITSYLPTTTLLASTAFLDNPDGKSVSLAVAGAGLLSVPIAVLAADRLNLDPGDTQLVRDAGFWGLVLATTGTLGFGTKTEEVRYGDYVTTQTNGPSARAVSAYGLAGLYGGLALGALAASHSEVSLERTRVTTWGGYGGAVLGGLLGAGAHSDAGVFRGIAIGAAAGLALTFALSSGLDGIPDEKPARTTARLRPTLMPATTAGGRSVAMLGLTGALP
jgi:hypothetical protein